MCQVLKATETTSSQAIEIETLRTCLSNLVQAGVDIGIALGDRHPGVWLPIPTAYFIVVIWSGGVYFSIQSC